MTLLMVTPYPPYRDGIGTYAVQEVRRLRAEGVAVEVLSPLPSAAHHHLALGNLRGVLALVRRARRHPRTMIQFSPEMFFGACRGPLERVAVWTGLEALARVTELEIRLHEIEFGPLARNPAERAAAARALRATSTVSVHTRPEVDRLVEALGLEPDDVTLVEHGRHFVPRVTGDQAEARAELGLDPDRHVFLAIGFLQEHKGFDRAAEAFRAAGLSRQAELHIVGSVRVNHPDLVAHARLLERLCRSIPGVHLHQRYVSDEDFDRWIAAADTVVLPYREIWSSSVLERAKLLERPIVAADVGGLGDQAPEGTLLFEDDESLAQCLKERAATTVDRVPAGAGSASGSASAPPSAGGEGADGAEEAWRVDRDRPDRAAIEAQVRQRVRRSRGLPDRPGVLVSDGHPAPAVDLAADLALDDSATAGLVRLPPLVRPTPTSARPGVGPAKRLLRRLLDWELAPVVAALNRLQTATTEAVAHLEGPGGDAEGGTVGPDRSLVEDPFVHGAVADLPPGARLALIGGAGSRLARALDGSGYRLTVLAPDDPPGEEDGLGTGRYDAVIVPSAAADGPVDGAGPDRSQPGPARYAPLLGPAGRLVLSTGRLAVAGVGPDDLRRRAAEIVPDLSVGYVGTASLAADRWRVDGPEAGPGAVERDRLAMVVYTARPRS